MGSGVGEGRKAEGQGPRKTNAPSGNCLFFLFRMSFLRFKNSFKGGNLLSTFSAVT